MSNQPTFGPIRRDGAFLYQLDGTHDGAINVWSGGLSRNNGYPEEHALRAARLFEAAPAMYEALKKLLATREVEAQASLSMENAQNNFTDCSGEVIAYETAMLSASKAEREARDLLAQLEGL